MPAPRPAVARRLALLLAVALGLVAGLAPAASAQAPTGPALSVPEEDLEAALRCTPDVDGASRTPVVLVHGTGSTPEESWSAGYSAILAARGTPACTVQLPNRSMTDAQLSSEYVVHAVRRARARSGREVSLVGHSQGTLQVLWAIAFWPDVAGVVDDAVLIASDYGGTALADQSCSDGSCAPSIWQQRPQSAFLRALRARGLAAGVDYTSIATQFDQIVVPAPQSSNVPGATNVVVQEKCPGRPVDHFTIIFDGPSVDLALDALENAGPTVPSRVPATTCAQGNHPQVDEARLGQVAGPALSQVALQTAAFPTVDREPALRCYVTGACAGAGRVPAVQSSRLYGKRVRGSRACRPGRRCTPRSVTLAIRGGRPVPGRVRYLQRRADGSFVTVGRRSLTLPAAGQRRALRLSRDVFAGEGRVRLRDRDYRLLLESREGGAWNVERAFTLRVGTLR